MSEATAGEHQGRTLPNQLAMLVPLAAFSGLIVVLAIGLTLNPREIPSPLIGKPVPRFELPPVRGRTLGLASGDLKGEVSLVNVFASCAWHARTSTRYSCR